MKKQIDFVGKRKIFIMLSLVLIIISLISIFSKGFNLGVEFTGGSEIIVRIEDPKFTESQMRKIVEPLGEEFAMARITRVKSLGDPPNISKFSIVVSKIYEAKEKGKITEAINNALKKSNVEGEIVSFSETGGVAAEEIKRGTWTAIIVATIVILLYITIRFNFVFGVGAIVALIHDVLITLGFFSFLGYEINVPAVAALLTLIGYSLNDTIVVCDRIRENMRKYRGRNIESIVNQSINEVIVRTINTSLTTLMVILMLFLFAGKVIKPFAFGMLIGTIIGTYSSLYIAAPIVIKWVRTR
ncbi:MAG TPA: protein translocase subunit SecF [Thermotoga sp.]|nr:protein translocase subunit SecF [Thermotoga sp.]